MISSGQRKRKLPILRFKVVPHVLDSEDMCIYNLLSEACVHLSERCLPFKPVGYFNLITAGD